MSAPPPVGALLPASVRAESGRGGLARLVVSTPAADAEIYLQGAHVTAWAPAGQADVIWMSDRSAFAPGVPIRGGVPVCFPWFGPHPSGSAPLHGFARISDWSLAEVTEDGDDVVLVLTLSDTDATRASAWPHRFRARYRVTIGATLTVALEVTNTGAEPITFAEAFHTYLGVGDIREASITGLEEAPYVDRLVSPEWLEPTGASLTITAETDRVYAQPGTIAVVDGTGARTLTVTAQGSANAVIWNPWVAKAAAMGDFGDDEWSEMVCVETCNVAGDVVSLAPGASHLMVATVSATSLH